MAGPIQDDGPCDPNAGYALKYLSGPLKADDVLHMGGFWAGVAAKWLALTSAIVAILMFSTHKIIIPAVRWVREGSKERPDG